MAMKDVGPVYHLGNSIFTANQFPIMYRTWDDFTVVEHYEGSSTFCFVVETTQSPIEIIGFLLGTTVTKATAGTRGYIEWVAMAPHYRRQGLAHALIQRFVQVLASTTNHHSLRRMMMLADTPADNLPAIRMFEKAGLSHKVDHVYLMCPMPPSVINTTAKPRVDEDDMTFQFTYTATTTTTAKKHRITIRNMEIDDLHPIHTIGEQIFTKKSANLYNFWDEHLVLQSYLSDPELCAVATVQDDTTGDNTVVGFAFGTTIEKPMSSWKYGYLVWLGCAPEFQGLGIAKQLYDVMLELFSLEKVRMLMIDTQQNNAGALRFFRKLGFGHEEQHVYLCNDDAAAADFGRHNNNDDRAAR